MKAHGSCKRYVEKLRGNIGQPYWVGIWKVYVGKAEVANIYETDLHQFRAFPKYDEGKVKFATRYDTLADAVAAVDGDLEVQP